MAVVLVLLQGWAFIPIAVQIPTAILPAISGPIQHETSTPPIKYESLATVGRAKTLVPQVDRTPAAWIAAAWLAILWLTGIFAISVRGVWRYLSLVSRLPLGRAPTEAEWLDEWHHVSRRNSVKGRIPKSARVQFRITENLGPLVCYLPFAYRILAPRKLWVSLDSRQRKAVLQHELAHVARHDLWKSAVIRVLALPQWFNPFAWKAVERFDEAAEWACDDFVMKTQDSVYQTAYPSALLRLAQSHLTNVPNSVAANDGNLSTRIRRLVQPRFKEESKMIKSLTLLLLVGIAVTQSVRISSTVAEEQPTADPLFSQNRNSFRVRRFHLALLTDQHRENLAMAGVLPYRVGSPDVIEVNLTIKDVPGEGVLNECLTVSPDGTVSIGDVGEIKVQDRTVDEIKAAIEARLKKNGAEKQVAVEVKHRNSKVFYVIVQGKDDHVHRIPCSLTSNVRGAIESLNLKIPLAESVIWVSRPHPTGKPNEDSIHPINWNELSGDMKLSNYFPLFPADRVFVGQEPSPNIETTVGDFRPLPPSPYYAAKQSDIRLDIQVLNDKQDNLLEFDELEIGSTMVADAKKTQAALRMLSKNSLTEMLCAPSITCRSGQQASLSVGTFHLETVATVSGSKLRVETRFHTGSENSKENQSHAAVELSAGQMVLMKTGADSSVYLAITPEILNVK